ncbi:MAG: sensor histidine kinase [Verrucomicrobiota bacterium]
MSVPVAFQGIAMRFVVPQFSPHKKVLLFFFWALLAGTGFSNADDADSRFYVRVWRVEEGLPSGKVRSVVQSLDGWIWVATAEGVVRFDGLRFSGFKQAPDSALMQLPARALFSMPNGDIWVNTAKGGLFLWHDKRFRVVWPDDDQLTTGSLIRDVDKVVQDGEGNVFILAGVDVWKCAGDAAPIRVEHTPAIDSVLQPKAPRSIYPSGGPCVLRDRSGNTWRAIGSHLTVSDANGVTSQVGVPITQQITQICELQEDREGNIWVATSEGLMQVCRRMVQTISLDESLARSAVRAVMEDQSGGLWVSTRGGGLARWTPESATQIDMSSMGAGREIVALGQGADGTIWAAPNVGPVLRVQNQSLRPAPFDGPLKVTCMVEDHRGRLWLGDAQGLWIWNGTTITRCALPTYSFSAIAVDASGRVWAATRSGLLFRSHDLSVERVGPPVPAARGISGLLPDVDGSVWISTIGAGLHHLVGEQCFTFSAEQGLPDERLTCVLDDEAGRLWLGSLGGIFNINKSELTGLEHGRRVTVPWQEFDRSDVMLTRECVGGPQPAGWHGREGQLWFSTAKGVVLIRPDRLKKNTMPPVVIIEQVSVNGRMTPSSGLVQAGPGRSRIEFVYTALSFTAPEKTRFRARLQGLGDWQDLGHQRRVAYDSVPPGIYRFELMAANRDEVWNRNPVSVAVKVLPQFWERTSARASAAVLVLLAAIGSGWGIARMRMKRRLAAIQLQSARAAERSRIARDLHDDLGASLTHISLFANMAAERERGGLGAKSALPEIANKAQALVGTLDEIVWAVNPRHDTLASMAEYLSACAAELLASAGMGLHLDVPRELPEVTLDAERRHNIFLAAREALNNAAKHSGASEVRLKLRVMGNRIEITIADNGSGFSTSAASTGDGLHNLRDRLSRIGGDCSIESQSGCGTTVHLSLSLLGTEHSKS